MLLILAPSLKVLQTYKSEVYLSVSKWRHALADTRSGFHCAVTWSHVFETSCLVRH